MPANSKYLTTSSWQRFSKISAGILGGYFVVMAIHLAFAAWFKHTNVIITATFTGFIGWIGFMIVAFYAKKWLEDLGLISSSYVDIFNHLLAGEAV